MITITIDDALRVLNEAVALDKKAITELCSNRVVCSDTFADHPTIQVGRINDVETNPYQVGLIGIINGLFGVNEKGCGHIAAIVEVVCPFHCSIPEHLTVNDECPHCHNRLTHEIREFVRTQL